MSAAETWNRFKTRTQRAFEEQPVLFIGVSAAAITSVAKLISADTERRNSKIHRREVERRIRKDRLTL